MKMIYILIITILMGIIFSSFVYAEKNIFWYNMSESNTTFWEPGAYYPGINISIGMVGFDGWANHTDISEREGNHFNVNESVYNFSSNFSLELGIFRISESNEHYIGLLNTFDGVNSMNGLFFTLEGNQWVVKYNNTNYWIHATIGVGKIGNMSVKLYYNLSGDNKFNVSINGSVVGNPGTSNAISIPNGNFTNVTLGLGQPPNASYDFIKFTDNTQSFFYESDAPLWSLNTTDINNPLFNQTFWFSVNISDNATLGNSIFSFYNGTAWNNDSAIQYNGTINDSLLNISKIINTIKHQNISWYWYFEDNAGNSNETDRWNYTIGNSPPIVNTTEIGPAPATDLDILTINASYFDIDLDTQVANETIWFNNSYNSSHLNNSWNVQPANLTGGQRWLAMIRFYDGENWSNWVNTTEITLNDNTPPSFLANYTSPTSVTLGDTIRIYLNLSDAGSAISATNMTLIAPDTTETVRQMYLVGGTNSAGQISTWNANFSTTALGTWYVRFNSSDVSGNIGNATNNPLSFSVTSSGGTPPSGGGGGGSVTECSTNLDCEKKFGKSYYCKSGKCLINLTSSSKVLGGCNYNGLCEYGESWFNCRCDLSVGCGNEAEDSGDCTFSFGFVTQQVGLKYLTYFTLAIVVLGIFLFSDKWFKKKYVLIRDKIK